MIGFRGGCGTAESDDMLFAFRLDATRRADGLRATGSYKASSRPAGALLLGHGPDICVAGRRPGLIAPGDIAGRPGARLPCEERNGTTVQRRGCRVGFPQHVDPERAGGSIM